MRTLRRRFTYRSTAPAAGSVTNAMLADMAEDRLKGRAEGAGTGPPQDLTEAQAKAILDITSSDVSNFSAAVAALLLSQRGAAAGTDLISTGVTADTNDRFVVNADGKLEWGGGAGALDTSLARSIAGVLTTNAFILSDGDLIARNALTGQTRIGNAGPGGEAGLKLGSTGDVNLYRPATDKLATDDGLVLNNGALAGATSSAVSFYAGTGAPNNANGVNGDSYWRLDGGALTTIYQRRAGAWVGII